LIPWPTSASLPYAQAQLIVGISEEKGTGWSAVGVQRSREFERFSARNVFMEDGETNVIMEDNKRKESVSDVKRCNRNRLTRCVGNQTAWSAAS